MTGEAVKDEAVKDGALLTVEDLRVSFPGKGLRAPRTEVLKGVSLRVGPGETLGMVGGSGSGKTTIGRAILGLVPSRRARSRSPANASSGPPPGSGGGSARTSRSCSRTRTPR